MTRALFLLAVVRHTTYAYELAERIHERTPTDVTVVSYEDRSREEIEVSIADGIKLLALGARSRFDPRAIAHLRCLLASGDYDLVHTHHNFVGSLGRALAPCELAIVDTQHANHREHYSLAQNAVNAATLWRADRVIANSEETRRSFYGVERRLVPAERIEVIYNGVDMRRIDAARSETDDAFTTDGRRIVTVGRMIETKNLETAIRAFDRVVDRFPDARLTMVGDGPERSRLKSLATDLGVRDRTEFTGTVPRKDVYRILDASAVFVLPSRSEGFCVAAVEAMACGVPVVVSDIQVLREVVGDAGAYADPDDPEAFAKRIVTLLEEDHARTTAASAARQRAQARFSLNAAADHHHRLYERLLE